MARVMKERSPLVLPAGDAALRGGAASVDITPPVGIAMQGYALRHAEEIADPLYASALAVGGSRGEWVLLSVDCIGLDREFTNRVRDSIARRLGMPASAATISCSHTHSGPATLRALGPVACDKEYLEMLEQRLVAVATAAAETMEPARWRFGMASLTENVNRRRRRRRRIELGVNPYGHVDSRLRVIRLDRVAQSDRAPLALIAHYACHATASGGVPHISADWPGAMRQALQQVYAGGGAPPVICFLQGCTGDVTHRVGRDAKAWPQHFGHSTSVQSRLIGRLVGAAALSASEQSVQFPAEAVEMATQTLDLPFRSDSGSERTEVQTVRIGPRSGRDGEAIWLIGLPGEPFSVYSTQLGRGFSRRFRAQPDRVLVSGYTNDCVGYLCTPSALRQGGYEAAQAHQIYHRPSSFSATTQARVFASALAAGQRLSTEAPRQRHSILTAGLRLFSRWASRS